MIRFYNSLTRQKEEFKPREKRRISFYTCGPTVYDFVHIGNLRTYIFQDFLRRILERAGYKVYQVMNITDIEDKIIRDSRKKGEDIFIFTRRYEKIFFNDLASLNIKKSWRYPRATEHLKEIISLIKELLERGLAYESGGSVYFNIAKFPKYGELSHLDKSGLKAGARVETDEYNKEDVRDFILWKTKKEGEPFWPSPWGEGRPGWHIECSAMSMKYFGKTLDIHSGGVDLLFPHHENEIAQSEGATGAPFVRYWLHAEHLLVDGQKMSKSLGNFYTLRDLEEKGYSPLDFRYLIFSSHYRSRLNFTWESLSAAKQARERLEDFARELASKKIKGSKEFAEKHNRGFSDALADDLNTPQALAIVWEAIGEYRRGDFDSRKMQKMLFNFDKVLDLNLKKIKPLKIPAEIKKLAQTREQYRAKKNWEEADRIRGEIKRLGWQVEDTEGEAEIKKMTNEL